MSQLWTADTYALTMNGATSLQNMEDNFTTLKSTFSGASAPSNNVAGQLWFDTTYAILKVRNAANSAWLGVMYGNSSNLIWMYANAATNGWVVYSSITDRVLAIKGGSQAYNVTGGNVAGTWDNATGLYMGTESADHAHYVSGQTVSTYHRHEPGASHGGFGFDTATAGSGETGESAFYTDYQGGTVGVTAVWSGGRSAAHAHSMASYTTYRPAAAVGTLQYPYA